MATTAPPDTMSEPMGLTPLDLALMEFSFALDSPKLLCMFSFVRLSSRAGGRRN
jgi:hypothetical protein